jgi:hypothetical protein
MLDHFLSLGTLVGCEPRCSLLGAPFAQVGRRQPVVSAAKGKHFGGSGRRSPAHRRAQLELPGHSANAQDQQQYRELEDQHCQVLAAVASADQPGVGGVQPRPVRRDSRSASCLHDLATRTTPGEQPNERASRGEHSESARQSKQQHLPLSGSTGGADRISRVSHDTFHLSWQRSRSINRSCQWRTSRSDKGPFDFPRDSVSKTTPVSGQKPGSVSRSSQAFRLWQVTGCRYAMEEEFQGDVS